MHNKLCTINFEKRCFDFFCFCIERVAMFILKLFVDPEQKNTTQKIHWFLVDFIVIFEMMQKKNRSLIPECTIKSNDKILHLINMLLSGLQNNFTFMCLLIFKGILTKMYFFSRWIIVQVMIASVQTTQNLCKCFFFFFFCNFQTFFFLICTRTSLLLCDENIIDIGNLKHVHLQNFIC